MKQVHLFISGFVQGVGFRNYVQHKAKKMGVFGWTRNLTDRRVEVVAQANPETLKKFISICERGPFLSQVKSVSINWEDQAESFSEFKRLPTL